MNGSIWERKIEFQLNSQVVAARFPTTPTLGFTLKFLSDV